ncbi:MAG: HAMP domain-containing sensor histidine kinase, partial [Bacteroidota bacterium]
MLNTSSRWPIYLALAGLLIVTISFGYTNLLASQLEEIEENNVQLYIQAMERVGKLDNLLDDVSTETEIIQTMETVPRILTDVRGEIVSAQGFGNRDTDTLYLQEQLQYLIENGRPPFNIAGQLIYFGESRLLRQLRFFPLVQLFLIGAFIFLGYLGINQARKAEQNRVWVGMAKETAHQLGTPISAIMGWVDYLKSMYPDNEDIGQVSDELGRDVDRLSMVANRFSKIGAEPDLQPVNIFTELDKCQAYMRKRAPRKVTFDFPAADAGEINAAINPLLFDWVLENLVRNALDAMDGKGKISGRVRELEDKVYIDISDTGKGIAPKNVRKVFNPGFTTKK